MQLRYSGNLVPPVDGMQKISSIAWSSNGKKMAVAFADRVSFTLSRLSNSLMILVSRKTNSQQNHHRKDKNHISFVQLTLILMLKKSLLHRVIILFLFIRLVKNGEIEKLL